MKTYVDVSFAYSAMLAYLFFMKNSSVCTPKPVCKGLRAEVPKFENGQKVTKKEAKPGKIVLFMKITSFFVCRKK